MNNWAFAPIGKDPSGVIHNGTSGPWTLTVKVLSYIVGEVPDV